MKTNIVKAALFTPAGKGRMGLPLLLWGEPGTVKTSIIEEVCARYALPCECLSPGERGEGAFGVVPVPIGKGADTVLRYPRPDWTEKFDNGAGGVVFVDEMTTAPPALQAPLLGLLLARRIGGFQLGPRVRVIGAANPPEYAAGGFDLASAVANRIGHIEWTAPTIEEHAAYMLRGDAGEKVEATLDAETEEARVEKLWPDAWAKARGLEVAFLSRRSNLKNACPKANDPKASRGWPSDRSWENATRAFASAEVHRLTESEREEFAAGFVGEGAASEFFAFATDQDLADPARVLDGKDKFTHSASRIDRTAALLSGCAALVTPAGATKRKERTEAMWGLVSDLVSSKSDLDVMVPPVQALVEAKLHAGGGTATKVLATLQPLLKAGGVRQGVL